MLGAPGGGWGFPGTGSGGREGLRKCSEGRKAEEGGAGGPWKSQKWRTLDYTFEFLKGIVTASGLSEAVGRLPQFLPLWCAGETGRGEVRGQAGPGLETSPGREWIAPPADQLLFPTGRATRGPALGRQNSSEGLTSRSMCKL